MKTTSTPPILPVLDGPSVKGPTIASPSLQDAKTEVPVARGAAALLLALKLSTTQRNQVLVPAFNCHTMITPIFQAGLEPIFYRIQPDLTPDLNDLESKLSTRTRALVVPHFFGFLINLTAVRQLCDRHNVTLIEDCAHAYFGSINDTTVGAIGDFAICSWRKFFPCGGGGSLVSFQHLALESHDSKKKSSLKTLVQVVEEAGRYGRLRLLNWPLRILQSFRGKKPTKAAASSNDGLPTFQPNWLELPSAASLKLYQTTKRESVVTSRRLNYGRLVSELSSLRYGRVLFQDLPKTQVPYKMPLLLENPETDFGRLKAAGLPMWRWDEVSRWPLSQDVCDTSDRYSLSLIQIPCHQSMTQSELEFICATLKKTIG